MPQRKMSSFPPAILHMVRFAILCHISSDFLTYLVIIYSIKHESIFKNQCPPINCFSYYIYLSLSLKLIARTKMIKIFFLSLGPEGEGGSESCGQVSRVDKDWIICGFKNSKYNKIQKTIEKAKTSRTQNQIIIWIDNISDNKINLPFIWAYIWEKA